MEAYMHRCTSMATMSFSAVVLFYEGFVYNMIFLRRILPALGKSAEVVPLAVLFNGVYFMAVWSYLNAHLANPGRIPDRFQEFVRDAGDKIPIFAAVPQWQPGKVTYCKSCDKTRPERAHHCHNCDVCVLRFDHHCLWINNCVGFNNHKHFLLVGIYCCAGLLIALVTALPQLLYCAGLVFRMAKQESFGYDERPLRTSDLFAFLVFGLLGFCVCLLLSAMLFVHLPRAARNLTAPEAFYTNMANPFDRGRPVGNLEQIFGVLGPDWVFPVAPRRRISDGVTFQHSGDPDWFRLDDEAEAEDLWRLRYHQGVPEPAKPPVCGNFF